LGALEAGRVSYAQSCVLVEETEHVSDDDAATVEAAVLGRAPGLAPGRLRPLVRRQVLRIDPAAARARRGRALADRRVPLVPLADDMALLEARLSAGVAAKVWAALHAAAVAPRDSGD